jgi:hypothetical protein
MCECVEKVNAVLAESNTVLDECCMVSMRGGEDGKSKIRMSLVIASMRLDQSKKRTKVRRVIPSFCPFCGEKIKTTSDDGAA